MIGEDLELIDQYRLWEVLDSQEGSQLAQLPESYQPQICTSGDYLTFRIMEFGVKVIPSVLFFILGTLRFLKIRDVGQGRVVYSLHFKIKFGISAIMGIAYMLYVFICWGQKPNNKQSSWINRCDDDYFVVFYALQGAAWLFSCFLMVYEYQRRLSEEWYANQLFWCLNFVFEVITFLVLVSDYLQDAVMMTLSIINMAGNLVLIILMVKTERRTLDMPRPEPNDNLNILLSNEQYNRRRSALLAEGTAYISVRFQDKFFQGKEGVNLFQFRVNTHRADQSEIKVTKKYSDFMALQDMVNEQAMKQSDLFGDSSINVGPSSHEDTNRSYRQTITGKILVVPRLEEPSSLFYNDRSYQHQSMPMHTSGPVQQQNHEQVVSFIKNLERFSYEVASNKIFWTREVLQFFGIEDEALRREFEMARAEYLEMRQRCKDSDGKGGHSRTSSYVEFQRPLLGQHEIEECAIGDSGSTKNAKKVYQNFLDGQNQGQGMPSTAPAASGLMSLNASQQQYQIAQPIEDSDNTLHKELLSGQFPLTIKFLMWQDSNIGNYIEFKMQVTYNEGLDSGNRSTVMSPHGSLDQSNTQNNSWIMYKRYSNFVDLHDQLVPFFKAEAQQVPLLPPRIANELNSQRNQALTKRKNQLQAYMRQLLLKLSDRAPLPLLMFLGLHEQAQFGFYSLEPVARLSAVNLKQLIMFDIVANKITFVNNAPKIFFKVVLRYKPHYPLPGQQSTAQNEEQVITFKQFSDFKQLDMVIKLTCFKMEESGHYMPVLPQKRKVSGNKKNGEELQSELVEYMHDLLKVPLVQRMVYMRMFLCVNPHAGISEQTFDEMGACAGLSPMNFNMQTYNEMSPGLNENRDSQRNLLLRESADIDQLVINTFAQGSSPDDLEFQQQHSSSSAMMHTGNIQSLHTSTTLEPSLHQVTLVTDDDEDDPFALHQ